MPANRNKRRQCVERQTQVGVSGVGHGLSIAEAALKMPTDAAGYEFLEDMGWDGNPELSGTGVRPSAGATPGSYLLKPTTGPRPQDAHRARPRG
jgi:hypothetical protein